jgi:hypothetical protein
MNMETKVVPIKKIDKVLYYKFSCLLIFSNIIMYLLVSPSENIKKSDVPPENYSRITWPVTSRLSAETNPKSSIDLYTAKQKLIIQNAIFIKEEVSDSSTTKLLTLDISNSELEILLQHTQEEIFALPGQNLKPEDKSHEVNL